MEDSSTLGEPLGDLLFWLVVNGLSTSSPEELYLALKLAFRA